MRIVIALVAAGIIAGAVYVSKQREVSIGSDGPDVPAALERLSNARTRARISRSPHGFTT